MNSSSITRKARYDVFLKYTAICSLIIIASYSGNAVSSELRLASTTSTKASGLLEVIVPAFEKKTGIKVKISATGSGKAMQLGRKGKADVLWVHSPEAEKKFISQSDGLKRHYTMHNDFLIACPKNDPANIATSSSVMEAIQRIANSQSIFISRADDSGTHNKELQLWKKAGIDPYGKWYYELGQGMNKALKVANAKQAYILIDRATWLFNKKSTTLKVCFEGDAALSTEYNLIAVNPAKHKKVNHSAAKKFIKFVTSNEGLVLIQNHKIEGTKLFKLDASKK